MTAGPAPRVIILGAGASGLGLAWRLASHGVAVDVLESAPIVGGLSGTVREDGYCLDFGPHSFFSEDSDILATVLTLFQPPLQPQPRRARFFYNGRYLDYPLTPAGVLLQMGFWSGVCAATSFLQSQCVQGRALSPADEDDESVEQWAIRSFGHYLYRTFFKPYTEQFWKVPCSELSARSIPSHTRTSFLNTLKFLVLQRFNRTPKSLVEREQLPTYYPETGFGEILENVASLVQQQEGCVHLSCRATAIEALPDQTVRVEFQCGSDTRHIVGDHVVSTIPLSLLPGMLRPAPDTSVLESAAQLDFRGLIVLGLVSQKQDILDCAYTYLLNRPYNRLSEMNKFSPQTSPSGENLLCVELCALRDSAAWHASKEELFDICAPSLAADGILAPGDVKKLLLVKAPYAYPIYRKDYARHLNHVLDEIARHPRLSTLGRSGEFMYMDSDKCLRRAFDLADQLLERFRTNHLDESDSVKHGH